MPAAATPRRGPCGITGTGPCAGTGVSRMSNAARSIAAAEPPGERTIRRVILASAAILLAIWDPWFASVLVPEYKDV